ncbi:hypothetical protein [Bradyrhizobium sp.]|uniref:hypothetical protein n=1 Tax=Bradyrhizobium sp. TaxID=376 RepID=UPI003C4988E5
MTKHVLFGVALLAFAGAAKAQPVVEDPGYCAQYYPNANCQNYGPGNPLYRGGIAHEEGVPMPHPRPHHRHRHHR